MPLVAVGLSYKSAPLELLESSAVPREHSAEAVRALVEHGAISEAVLISTCNRVEVYVGGEDEDAAAEAVRNIWVERCRVDPRALDEGLFTHRGDAVASHLFRVAAGLDSMIVGESEILGQVRQGFRTAAESGAVGSELEPLFRHALRTGKRVRSETELSRHAGSVAAAAVNLLPAQLGRMRVVIVGAGRIAEMCAEALLAAGLPAGELVFVARSSERARPIAEQHGAADAPLADLGRELAGADAAVCCTAAVGAVVDAAVVGKRERPLTLVDLAVPRDVDPAVGELPNVTLHDLAHVQAAAGGDESRLVESARLAEVIVAEEVDAFRRTRRAAEAGPTIASLLESAEAIRRSEIARVRGRLDEGDEALLDEVTRRLVANLLHGPIEAAREAGGDSASLRELFRLP